LQYYYNNLVSSMHLFMCCELFEVSKIVFSSSCTVYGDKHPDRAVVEQDDASEANCPYGQTKVQVSEF
jgi:UDP-glucose 4-epimerase